MSQENVEIVRHWIALSNAGDVTAILNLLDPDIACFPAEGEPESEAFRGREAYARRAYEARDAFDQHHIASGVARWSSTGNAPRNSERSSSPAARTR